MKRSQHSGCEALAPWLNALFGAERAGAFVEVRHRLTDRAGMGQRFFSLAPGDTTALLDHILTLGQETDVYLGVAPRRREAGTRDAVEQAHVLWADVDGSDALKALRRFRPRPAIVVRSGSPDSVHAYWPIFPAVTPDEAEKANRRLAHALSADMRSTDAARILRPPGTLNFKSSPPAPVELAHLEVEVFTAAQVAGDLPDPPQRRQASPTRLPRRDPEELRSQDAAATLIARYAPETELRAGGNGRLHGRCPLPNHEDRNPSFGLFPDGGYVCSCGTGDIIRLFVHLRGEIFTDSNLPLYERELREELGLEVERRAA